MDPQLHDKNMDKTVIYFPESIKLAPEEILNAHYFALVSTILKRCEFRISLVLGDF